MALSSGGWQQAGGLKIPVGQMGRPAHPTGIEYCSYSMAFSMLVIIAIQRYF